MNSASTRLTPDDRDEAVRLAAAVHDGSITMTRALEEFARVRGRTIGYETLRRYGPGGRVGRADGLRSGILASRKAAGSLDALAELDRQEVGLIDDLPDGDVVPPGCPSPYAIARRRHVLACLRDAEAKSDGDRPGVVPAAIPQIRPWRSSAKEAG